jgi:hypothetical protein
MVRTATVSPQPRKLSIDETTPKKEETTSQALLPSSLLQTSTRIQALASPQLSCREAVDRVPCIHFSPSDPLLGSSHLWLILFGLIWTTMIAELESIHRRVMVSISFLTLLWIKLLSRLDLLDPVNTTRDGGRCKHQANEPHTQHH